MAEHPESRRILYERVCSQHDGIAEFRGKLLSLLPLASGAGIFLLVDNGDVAGTLRPHLGAIGGFGLAVTTGLFFYELRGIQNCHALIQAARHLEQKLSAGASGAFQSKPRPTWGVGAETAALIVYPSVAGAWTYLGSLTAGPASVTPSVLAAVLVVAAYAIMGHRVLRTGRTRQQQLGDICTLNRQSFRAEDRRDRAMLEPVLHEAFRIDRSNGVQQDKTVMLEGLAKSPPGQRVILREVIEVVGSGSVVASTLIRYHEANELVGEFWNTKVFVRSGSDWRCRSWQVARVDRDT